MIDSNTETEEPGDDYEYIADKDAPLDVQVRRLRKQISTMQKQMDSQQSKEDPKPSLMRSKMSRREQIEYVKTHGREKYLALPWDDQPKKRRL